MNIFVSFKGAQDGKSLFLILKALTWSLYVTKTFHPIVGDLVELLKSSLVVIIGLASQIARRNVELSLDVF